MQLTYLLLCTALANSIIILQKFESLSKIKFKIHAQANIY